MSKPFGFGEKIALTQKYRVKKVAVIAKESNLLVFAIAMIIFAIMISLWDRQTTSYAHAYFGGETVRIKKIPALLQDSQELFKESDKVTLAIPESVQKVLQSQGKDSGKKIERVVTAKKSLEEKKVSKNFLLPEKSEKETAGKIDKLGLLSASVSGQALSQEREFEQFEEKLYGIVGETPLKEMVPFISRRDEKVAAFLVGIAKKESSFGLASPSKDGETCYNYWGYKSSGERGTAMGYACFASAEEAIKVVGNRIEVLVNKQRNTPARMVDTWKCGTSCAGDPGAPGWTSTVALYFNQIVRNEG